MTDAYTALRHMLRWRVETFGDEPDETPLFCFDDEKHYQVRHARALFKSSGEAIGVDMNELGAQSARIGGATDLMVTNCSPVMLQVAGRWDSDLYAIYTRQCLGQVLEMNRKAALVVDPDIESLMPKHTQHARKAPRHR